MARRHDEQGHKGRDRCPQLPACQFPDDGFLILETSELYSGIIGRASINFYAFNSNGNKGIACGLNNLQKLADGTPLGGHSRAEDDFADLDDDDDDFLS